MHVCVYILIVMEACRMMLCSTFGPVRRHSNQNHLALRMHALVNVFALRWCLKWLGVQPALSRCYMFTRKSYPLDFRFSASSLLLDCFVIAEVCHGAISDVYIMFWNSHVHLHKLAHTTPHVLCLVLITHTWQWLTLGKSARPDRVNARCRSLQS